ncbi:MAG: hypothetical protein R3228_16180, partial [Halioglobus sp.]|nr:hypothetical protein [Halioglobus sp.]
MLAIPQIMRLMDFLGFGISLAPTAALVAALAAVCLLLGLLKRPQQLQAAAHPLRAGERWLIALVTALILARLANLGLELIARPLYPWDATMHWATKARVWFEYRSMVPFVSNQEWLDAGGSGVFTDRHPYYPATVPLLQVWMNVALDRWDESLMNLPWLFCLAGLGAAFYGQLRIAGVDTAICAVATYLLLSMPLMNTHVALAGYADLFLGAAYACALMSMHNWIRLRQSWLAGLALLFAAFCPLIKNEGFIWTLTLIPAVATIFMQRRQAAKLFLLLLLWVVLLMLILPQDWEVAGNRVQDLLPTFNMEALLGVIKSTWLHNNWHLLGYLLLVFMPIGLLMPGVITRSYLAITTALASSVGAYLYLFLFTGFGEGAADFAAVGRLSIHLVPALLFLCALVYHRTLVQKVWPLPGTVLQRFRV